MSGPDDKPSPASGDAPAPPAPKAPTAREARLAKALRDNLRRRKAPGRLPPGPSSGG